MHNRLPIAAALLTTPLLALPLLPAAAQDAAPAAEAELHPIAADVAAELDDPTEPFVIVVHFTVKAGRAKAFIEAMAEPQAETVKEPGNDAYSLSRGMKKKNRFVLYERWKSLEALDSHLKQPYLTVCLAKFDELLKTDPKVTVWAPVEAAAP